MQRTTNLMALLALAAFTLAIAPPNSRAQDSGLGSASGDPDSDVFVPSDGNIPPDDANTDPPLAAIADLADPGLCISALSDLVEDVANADTDVRGIHGVQRALQAKVDAALVAIADGDAAAALDSLDALINQAEAQAGKKLADNDASTLVAAASDCERIVVDDAEVYAPDEPADYCIYSIFGGPGAACPRGAAGALAPGNNICKFCPPGGPPPPCPNIVRFTFNFIGGAQCVSNVRRINRNVCMPCVGVRVR